MSSLIIGTEAERGYFEDEDDANKTDNNTSSEEQNDDYADAESKETKEIKSHEKILFSILSHLKLQDLLTCRLVNHFWHDVICKHSSTLLWSKACLAIKTTLKSKQQQRKFSTSDYGYDFGYDEVSPRELLNKTINEWNLWKSFISSNLFTQTKCPNFHLVNLDLRHENIKSFFQRYGSSLESLLITDCELSLITFQKIYIYCPNLKIFKLKPVPYYSIIFAESIGYPNSTRAIFSNLTTLILYSDYEKHFYSYNSNMDFFNHAIDDHFDNNNMSSYTFDMIENHLHENVVAELLSTASQLETIQLYGWTGQTLMNVLKGLAAQTLPCLKLKQLEFHDLLNSFDTIGFENILSKSLVKYELKSFALTFLNPFSPTIKYSRFSLGLNSCINAALVHYSKTLIKLTLTNCPVNEDIFANDDQLYFPQLENLDLAGTYVQKVSPYVKYMPNLAMINFEPKIHPDDTINENIMMNEDEYKYKKSHFTKYLMGNFYHQLKQNSSVEQLQSQLKKYSSSSSTKLVQFGESMKEVSSIQSICTSIVGGVLLYLLYPFAVTQFGPTLGRLFVSLILMSGVTLYYITIEKERTALMRRIWADERARKRMHFYDYSDDEDSDLYD